ncbi:MAG: L-seryl-tRNA(Sec) selenium transferase [Armatimonas sp.]
MSNPFRDLPSVEKLSASLLGHSHTVAVEAARQAIEEARNALKADKRTGDIFERAAILATELERPTLRRAINATGVVLHTNLGRATLAESAERAIAAIASGHATLETDEESGGRGSRQAHCATLLRKLTGAEDALVVNNNAAATFLAIAGLAARREVILSRGQMIEIGGHFRLPEVIQEAGAKLIEVGTTNRTRISDYARAITEETALLLRCHPSNYRVVGFTEQASLKELVALGCESGIPVGDDIGSGALVDLAPFGLTDEPTVKESLAAGANLVWFSGDKLLGGPQCGVLLGRTEWIQKLARHPLMRALRPDKLTLAALEATLRIYLYGEPLSEIPALRRIARPVEDIRVACERVGVGDIVETVSEVGGGSLPGLSLPSYAVAIDTESPALLARRLRLREEPIFGRIERGRFLLDLRCVDTQEEEKIQAALTET